MDIEPNKHGATLGFMYANEFGADVTDIEKNKLLYYLMAAAEQSLISGMIYDDFLDQSPKRRTRDAGWVKHGSEKTVNATSALNMQMMYNLRYY